MHSDVTRRPWFTTCHARIAGCIAGCMMLGRVTPHTPNEITRQLEKAYRMGRRDGMKELRARAFK